MRELKCYLSANLLLSLPSIVLCLFRIICLPLINLSLNQIASLLSAYVEGIVYHEDWRPFFCFGIAHSTDSVGWVKNVDSVASAFDTVVDDQFQNCFKRVSNFGGDVFGSSVERETKVRYSVYRLRPIRSFMFYLSRPADVKHMLRACFCRIFVPYQRPIIFHCLNCLDCLINS